MWRDINFSSVNVNSEIRIVRFSGGDAFLIDRYRKDLKELVEMLSDSYEGIESWFDNKVIPGLKEEERFAYIVYFKEKPIASCIVKKGDDSKLCSMRILPGYQEKGIGTFLMSLIGKEIKRYAGKIHFTAPETIYESHKVFFNKLGFVNMGEAGTQYRLFDKELWCEADTKILWKNILSNLDGMIQKFTIKGNSLHPDLVMSIKPEFAEKIKKQKKRVEIRRKFNKKWKNSYVMLYASAPYSEFFGEAKISDIIEDDPKEIWKLFGSDIGVDEGDFWKYCKDINKVNALVLSEIDMYKNSILKNQVEFLLNKELKSPQSYSVIDGNSTWPTAVALNYLLLA